MSEAKPGAGATPCKILSVTSDKSGRWWGSLGWETGGSGDGSRQGRRPWKSGLDGIRLLLPTRAI